MYIMASPTGQGIKIDALVLETRVLSYLFPVAPITGGKLVFPVVNRIRFDMTYMAGGAVNVSPVVRAVAKFDHARTANFTPVAGKAGIDLFISWRNF